MFVSHHQNTKKENGSGTLQIFWNDNNKSKFDSGGKLREN
jgi:hypothetical protein